MEDDSPTIEQILDIENRAFYEAEEKYGAFFTNAMGFNQLLNSFVVEADPDAFIFVMFLSQVKKHILLAIFSTLRQHHVQAMLNMRQVLEAGANAAYGLGVPNHEDFVNHDVDGILDAPSSLSIKRYTWLNENFPAASLVIKRQKDHINNSCAHSNMIYVFNNFEMDFEKNHNFTMNFFDKTDDYMIKTDLWFTANMTMGLVDLFYGVNKKHPRIKLVSNFATQLKKLEAENLALKQEMEKHPRYVAAMERSLAKD